jgi:hypothetical protein
MPNPAEPYIIGREISVTFTPEVGGVAGTPVELYVQSGNAEDGTTVVRLTNSRSGGWAIVKGGIRQNTGSLTLLHHSDDAPPEVEPNQLADLLIEADVGDTNVLILNQPIMIERVNRQWEVEGAYTLQVSYQTTGEPIVVVPGP